MLFPLLQGTCEMTRRRHYLLITPIGCGWYQLDQLPNCGLFSCIGQRIGHLLVDISVALNNSRPRYWLLWQLSVGDLLVIRWQSNDWLLTDCWPMDYSGRLLVETCLRLDWDSSDTQLMLDHYSDWDVGRYIGCKPTRHMIRQLYLQPPSQNPPIQTLCFNLRSHKWPAPITETFFVSRGWLWQEQWDSSDWSLKR